MRTPRLPAVDWTDAPTDLNVLVRFGERRNLVSARVPSRSARAIQTVMLQATDWTKTLLFIEHSYCSLALLKVENYRAVCSQGRAAAYKVRKCVSEEATWIKNGERRSEHKPMFIERGKLQQQAHCTLLVSLYLRISPRLSKQVVNSSFQTPATSSTSCIFVEHKRRPADIGNLKGDAPQNATETLNGTRKWLPSWYEVRRAARRFRVRCVRLLQAIWARYWQTKVNISYLNFTFIHTQKGQPV